MMMPPMQKMAAPLALARALCPVATIAVIGNMHVQPSTLRDTPAVPPRPLLESPDVDALVSVRAQLAGLRAEPETMRHYVRLSRKNYAIDLGLYPLGSCTMKHNPRLNEKVARLPGFAIRVKKVGLLERLDGEFESRQRVHRVWVGVDLLW